DITPSRDRGTKTLQYIGNISVNGFPSVRKREKPHFEKVRLEEISNEEIASLSGTKQILEKHGPEGVSKWLKEQEEVLLTDTTFRDAHQSLLATRMRTYDMLQIAPETAKYLHDAFSLEMWDGAAFDVAYNFLNENAWDRLTRL